MCKEWERGKNKEIDLKNAWLFSKLIKYSEIAIHFGKTNPNSSC